MEEAESVVTPETVLAEIARKYIREGANEETARSRLSTIMEASESMGTDEDTAWRRQRHLQLNNKRTGKKKTCARDPSLFDAIVLACAQEIRCEGPDR
jgi:predicted nucleic acid-binding protein